MANEVELERMVFRLVGDNSDLRKTYDQTLALTLRTAGQVKAAAKGVEASVGDPFAGIGVSAANAKKSMSALGGVQVPGGSSTVQIDVDTTSIKRAYERSAAMGKGFANQVKAVGRAAEDGLEPAAEGMSKFDIRARDARRTLMLLGQAEIISPAAAHSVWLVSEGFSSVQRMVGGVVGSLGTLKGALIATGIGALAVGIGAMSVSLTRLSADLTIARESAAKAFVSMASGARTAQQALAEMRIGILTEGLQELTDTINPGFWQGIWNGVQGAVGLDPVDRLLQRIIERARAAETAFAALQSNAAALAIRREAASRTLVQSSRDQAQALMVEATAAGMVDRLAQQRMVQERLALAIRREGETLDEARNRAMARLRGSFDQINAANRNIDFGRLTLQLQDLTREADRAGMTDVGSRLTAMAQEFARSNPGVTLAESFRTLQPILRATAEQMNRLTMGNFLRDLRLQGATMGLSAERAQLFRMSLDGVSDANIMAAESEVHHLEALRALQAGLEDVQGVRFGSTEALARVAQYNNQFAAALQGASIRQRLLTAGQSGLQSPAGSAVLSPSVGAGVAAAREAERQRLLGGPNQARPANAAAAALPAPAGAQPQQPAANPNDPQTALLAQVVNLLQQLRDQGRPNNQPPGVQLAPAGVP